jgi:hypothetical protein
MGSIFAKIVPIPKKEISDNKTKNYVKNIIKSPSSHAEKLFLNLFVIFS